jgi:CRP-like cAMP-binding protein
VRSADIGTGTVVGRNGLLAALPPAELEHMRPHLQAVSLRPRGWFQPAEVPLSHVYFPLGGMLSLMVSTTQGAAVEVAVVGREGMLGVSVVLEANQPPFEMLCQAAGEALRMPAADCARLVQQLPVFRRRLLRYALAVLHETSLTAACNGLHTVEQRLARWLLLCSARVGANTFPMTHEWLAHMLGVTRPFVTQTLGRLTQAGLIEHQRGTLRIIDSAGLEALACADYRAVLDAHARLLG